VGLGEVLRKKQQWLEKQCTWNTLVHCCRPYRINREPCIPKEYGIQVINTQNEAAICLRLRNGHGKALQ
jgi:hypothetical protein